MAERKPDRRVRKTRKLLKDCLVTLLQTKQIQDITVREIAEMADINRGTFYLHYRDAYDLLEQTEADLLGELEALVTAARPGDTQEQIENFFTDVFTLVAENAVLVRILIGEYGDLRFFSRLKTLVREKFVMDWIGLYREKNADVFEAYLSFLVSGCLGLVQYWLQADMKESPEELARLAKRFVLQASS